MNLIFYISLKLNLLYHSPYTLSCSQFNVNKFRFSSTTATSPSIKFHAVDIVSHSSTSSMNNNSKDSNCKINSNPFVSPLTGVLRSFGGAFPPISTIPLPPSLFAVPPRLDLIHRVVGWFRAGLRVGLAAAKGRGAVAGSNRKIHAQKGTGRARAGDAAAPHRRGGKKHKTKTFTFIKSIFK